MPNVLLRLRVTSALYVLAGMAIAAAQPARAQISFYTAVDLALRNSPEVKMSAADVQHAVSGLKQATDAYIPSMSVGSSLGYSYGFPVGQPSIIDVTANSLLLSFSQPDVIRAARASVKAAEASMRDTREKVVAETALAYVELNIDMQELAALEQQRGFGEQLVAIERQRKDAGVASAMDLTLAKLTDAQLELRLLNLQKHMNLLRLRLSNLTGLPEDDIKTETASIPGPPAPPAEDAALQAINNSPAVQSAQDDAQSKQLIARADRHKLWRPEIAFGIQYSRYAKFNNYAEYYLRFQHNNFDVGINMTLPIFDAEVKARARASAADAVHAEQQAKFLRMQLAEQNRQATDGLDELRLQQKIAGLQSDYAQENLQAVETQVQNGSANPNASPLTPLDQQKARIEERRRFVDKLDADFQLLQAEIQLRRSLGTAEEWAMHAPTQ